MLHVSLMHKCWACYKNYGDLQERKEVKKMIQKSWFKYYRTEREYTKGMKKERDYITKFSWTDTNFNQRKRAL